MMCAGLKKALNALGYYMPDEDIGISGIPDARMFVAVTWFQIDNDLRADGTIRPDDETQERINQALADNKQSYYIWRTMGDAKVRAGHAAIRQWGESPDPGDEENSRCWGEPISDQDVAKLYSDAINPSVSPLDFIGPAAAGRALAGTTAGLTSRLVLSHLRDVRWIRNASQAQLQRKFKHAEVFGIKGNVNKKIWNILS